MNQERQLAERGFVRLSAKAVSESTLAMAERVGVVSLISEFPRVQELVPRASDRSLSSTYAGIHGLNAFPLHTDLAHWCIPPHYILLRCAQPGPGTRTLVIHSDGLFADEDETTLRRALFRPRRRLDGRLTSLRLIEGGRCRWDSVFLTPVTKIARELRDRMLRRIDSANVDELSFDGPTDCVLFDNWKVLHGRSSVPAECVSRKLERVYLDSVYCRFTSTTFACRKIKLRRWFAGSHVCIRSMP
jgi:hypothetical protein